jgi:hypothetical protein
LRPSGLSRITHELRAGIDRSDDLLHDFEAGVVGYRAQDIDVSPSRRWSKKTLAQLALAASRQRFSAAAPEQTSDFEPAY